MKKSFDLCSMQLCWIGDSKLSVIFDNSNHLLEFVHHWSFRTLVLHILPGLFGTEYIDLFFVVYLVFVSYFFVESVYFLSWQIVESFLPFLCKPVQYSGVSHWSNLAAK